MINYNMILTETQKKYQHYHLEKLINITGKELRTSNRREIIEQGKSGYSLLGKALEKEKSPTTLLIFVLLFKNVDDRKRHRIIIFQKYK